MKKPLIAAASCAVLVVSALFAAGPATAAGAGHNPQIIPGTPTTLAGGFVSPLSIDVDSSGNTYTTQNFAGVLTKVTPSGVSSEVASAPGGEISAVSTRGGTVYYAQLAMDHSSAKLMSKTGSAAPKVVGDLYEHESKKNPDGNVTYGFVGLPQSCAGQFGPDSLVVPVYKGIVDTHPYGSVATAAGVYVADAGANAVLKVGYDGKVSTVAVLPPGNPVAVTAAVAEEYGIPACAVGYKFRFESVPTDVAVGPDGSLYVTSLPGGPENASLGARGGIYKVNPTTGAYTRIIGSLVGATGLSVTPAGSIYVAELFGGAAGTGRISVVRVGAQIARPVISLSFPAAVTFSKDKLYVTTDVLAPTPDGKITVVPLTYK